jgi:hypothetical protein
MAVMNRMIRGQVYDIPTRRWMKKETMATLKSLRNVVETMQDGPSWGDLAMQDEDARDARFLAMTNEEYLAFLMSEEGIQMTGDQMIHINLKRMRNQKMQEQKKYVEEDKKTCAYWYNEYTRFPHLYFANEAEQKEAIQEIVAEWRTSDGRWRLGNMETAAKTIQGAWSSWKSNRCQVCKTDRAKYIDKYESAVCESCMNPVLMCDRCEKDVREFPGNTCRECKTLPCEVCDQNPAEYYGSGIGRCGECVDNSHEMCKKCQIREWTCPGSLCAKCAP